MECKVDFVTVRLEGATKAGSNAPEGSSAAANGRVVWGGIVGVEEGMFGKESEIECDQGGVDEVDDEDLGGGDEAEELVGAHRFFAGVLGLGEWEKTSRKSFSSRRVSSRSAATVRSSSPRFMRTL